MASQSAAATSLRRPNMLNGISRLRQHFTASPPHANVDAKKMPLGETCIVIEHVESSSGEDDKIDGENDGKMRLSVGSHSSTSPALNSADTLADLNHLTSDGEIFTFRPAPVDTTSIRIPANVLRVVELIARNIHELWSKNKIAAGWSFSPERDDDMKSHPSLMPYDDLSESEKSYDIDLVKETIKTVLAFGFDVERSSSPSMQNGEEAEKSFKLVKDRRFDEQNVPGRTIRRAKRSFAEPPPTPSTLLAPNEEPILHVKHMNLPETLYRQPNGYKPEPLDFSTLPSSLSEPQNFHLDDLIDRLAQNVHNVWAEKRLRAGWRHGQSEDSHSFRSPHLVRFDELEEAVKKANMDTAQATILSLIAYGFQFVSRRGSKSPRGSRDEGSADEDDQRKRNKKFCRAASPSFTAKPTKLLENGGSKNS